MWAASSAVYIVEPSGAVMVKVPPNRRSRTVASEIRWASAGLPPGTLPPEASIAKWTQNGVSKNSSGTATSRIIVDADSANPSQPIRRDVVAVS